MQLEILIDEHEIKKNVKEMGIAISNYYSEGTVLSIICVLKGALLFTADLIKEINLNTNIEFLDISSYKGKERGEIQLNSTTDFFIKGKDVLVVEDIIDSGNTINYIVDQLKGKDPKSIKVATLLFKPDVYNFDMKIDWIGFNIKNEFVVGYGLDYNELYRNKKSIYKINDE